MPADRKRESLVMRIDVAVEEINIQKSDFDQSKVHLNLEMDKMINKLRTKYDQQIADMSALHKR